MSWKPGTQHTGEWIRDHGSHDLRVDSYYIQVLAINSNFYWFKPLSTNINAHRHKQNNEGSNRVSKQKCHGTLLMAHAQLSYIPEVPDFFDVGSAGNDISAYKGCM